jgi:hypothetical protein
MPAHRFSKTLGLGAAVCLLCCSFFASAYAEGPSLPGAKPLVQPSSLVSVTPSERPSQHRFWDKKNRVLFAAVAALNVADFAVTHANLQNGGRELNPMVRVFGGSTPALAANFAGGTAGVLGISYLFHKTGHHKLERIISMVNIGASSAAVTYGLIHR